jgi:hypothetical protein
MASASHKQIKLLVFTSVALCLLYLVSCASSETADLASVDQNEVHQYYWADYYDAESELRIGAQLRFHSERGTTLRLSGSASLSVDGTLLEENPNTFLYGTWYGLVRSNTRIPETGKVLHYQWLDANNKSSTQTLHLKPLLFGAIPSKHPISEVFTFQWMTPLGDRENLHLILTDSSGTQIDAATNRPGDTILEISTDRLKFLQPGPIQVQIQYEALPKFDKPRNPGGAIRATWHGTPQSFELRAGAI